MKKIFMALSVVLLAILCCITNVKAETFSFEQEEGYTYPITPEDAEWQDLGTVEAKIKACRIPKEILAELSDEQLIQSVLDFPFINDVTACNSYEEGVEHIQNICDAYAELVKRDSGFTSLMKKVEQRTSERETGLSVDEEIEDDILSLLILCQDEFQNEITGDTVYEVNQICDLEQFAYSSDMTGTSLLASGGPKTPKGSAVPYSKKTCNYLDGYHEKVAQNIASDYGVTLIAVGSCVFNCHSYAWYSQSTSNKYWIGDPTIYMTDGSYTKHFSGTTSSSSLDLAKGDKLYYPDEHSAIVTSLASGVPLGTREVESKWGQNGIYRHSVSNVPSSYFSGKNLSGWR